MTVTNLTHEPIEGEHFIVVSETTGDDWEIVVGLEVHCELATVTKLFCGCPNMFGDEPNTNVCPVCLGLPGSLPVLNHNVVELAMRLGRALHCSVEPSVFARKNYFYPDMPKDYQVSQFDRPINVDGWLDLPDGTRVGIERAHIEEDTGKNSHAGGSGRIHGADYSLVDYNRAGVPLVEIVGRPHIRHPEQAKAYIDELRAILLVTGASDAKMEEGSLRVDANVSVRRVGDTELGTRCEVKNLNSLRSLGRAIEYEARRQVDLLETGERIKQETRHWDEGAGRTRPGRSKEEAEDYRYFQEPDLVPLEPSAEWVDAIDAAMPPLPAERREALATAVGVATTDPGVVIAVHRDLDALALAAIDAGADGRRAGDRRASHRHAGQDRVDRDGRHRSFSRGDRGRSRLRGDGNLRTRDGDRCHHRREPDRVVRLLLRRREAPRETAGVLRRQGHEGDQGTGRRQGGQRRTRVTSVAVMLIPARSSSNS
jgi:aspartyl-tRNA(Asn)/glutamyl-tRNA(Gln) amidotransferase subunit B